MTGRVSKNAVYLFLGERKIKVISKEMDPLNEKVLKLKDEHTDKLLGNKVNLEELIKDMKKMYETTSIIRDLSDFGSGRVSKLNNELGIFYDVNSLKGYIKNAINWREISIVDQALTDVKDKRAQIDGEFEKLTAMVKKCKTGNDAARELKKLGFDTSNIKSPKQMELTTINVDKNLLGLPDEVKK